MPQPMSSSAPVSVEPSPSPETRSVAPSTYVVQGRPVAIPVVVRDAVVIQATFPVSAAAVRKLVPPALHVPEVWPGTALCALAAVEYLDNDLGRYNEVAVSFFVLHGGPAPWPLVGLVRGFRAGAVGAYLHRLPVTTSFSCDAGRDIWGFPKTVAEIAFRDDGERRVCVLVADGRHVLTFAAPLRGERTMAPMPQDSFAWRDGVLTRTPSTMSGRNVGFRLGGAELTLGEHPMADELRTLGLPRRALMTTSFGRMQATFQAPERVA